MLLRRSKTRARVAATTLAAALAAASPSEAHGIFDLVLTGGPLLGVEPISGTALGGVSVSGGLGGGDSLTALVFRFELLGALGGFEGAVFGGAVMFRWDLGARSRRIGLAAVFGVNGTDQQMAFFGRYIEVVPHARIVWTNEEGDEDGAVSTVTFEEKDGQTRGVVHDLYPSKEALDEAIASGSTEGMPEQLDQLDGLIVTLGA